MIEKLETSPPASASALGWLVEHELVNSPSLLNAMILNVYKLSKGITDVQFVIDAPSKKLLIYLEVTRWTRWFHLKDTEQAAMEVLDQALPSYKKRVVFDRSILNKAIELVSGTKSEG